MSITLDDLAFLTSPAGEKLLTRLADEDTSAENTLRLITSLRKDYGAREAAAALELAQLRKKAVGKFGDEAAGLFLSQDALEQASDPVIRAWRVGHLGAHSIVDACCGIGADALTFAQRGVRVTGIDLDPVRIEMARLNAAALGINAQFIVGDVRDTLPNADAIFFDPARRDDGKRLYDVEAYHPPLSTLRTWGERHVMVKLSPGVDLAQLDGYYGWLNFVSVDGDLKEALLTLDPSEFPDKLLGAKMLYSHTSTYCGFTRQLAQSFAEPPQPTEIDAPRAYLVEPDPAIIRAGVVGDAARGVNGTQLDPEIAYFTTDDPPDALYLKAWRIREWMPFNLKKLRAHLQAHNISRVTVKKRGTAITPEDLIGKLKPRGDGDAVTLVVTRLRGDLIVLICDEMPVK